MNIDAVQHAILNKDADRVGCRRREWNEKNAPKRLPHSIFLMLALGFEQHVTSPCDLRLDSPDVVAKRKATELRKCPTRRRTSIMRCHTLLGSPDTLSLRRSSASNSHASLTTLSVPFNHGRSTTTVVASVWYANVTGENNSLSADFWAYFTSDECSE